MRPHRAAKKLDSTYRVVIRIPSDPAAVYVHPIRLQDRLPEIIIPLRRDDPQIKLDLQTMLEHAYESGRYHRRLSYREKLEPALNAADAKWAAELLASRVVK